MEESLIQSAESEEEPFERQDEETPRQPLTQIFSKRMLILALKTISMILLYYLFSISLTFYNKKLMTASKLGLSITMVHLVTKFALSFIIRLIYRCYTGTSRVTIACSENFRKICPPGIASSLDIGFSNWGLEYVTVSLYTMTKSTVIIFILIFSIVFSLEKPRKSIVVVVILIAVGLFLFTFELTQFSLFGFSLVLSASCLSGIRWTLAQLVMQRSSLGLSNPIDMIFYIQPWMIMALLPLVSVVEGNHMVKIFRNIAADKYPLTYCFKQSGLILAGAFLAFFMECSEYLLLSSTSSLTLSISGIFKEIITLSLASVLNDDKLNNINIIGLVMCLFGIIVHISIKAQKEARSQSGSLNVQSAESSPAKREDVLRSLLRNSRTISESSYTFE